MLFVFFFFFIFFQDLFARPFSFSTLDPALVAPMRVEDNGKRNVLYKAASRLFKLVATPANLLKYYISEPFDTTNTLTLISAYKIQKLCVGD